MPFSVPSAKEVTRKIEENCSAYAQHFPNLQGRLHDALSRAITDVMKQRTLPGEIEVFVPFETAEASAAMRYMAGFRSSRPA